MKSFIRANLLPTHLVKAVDTTYHIGPSSVEPFPIGAFAKYLQATFFCLCQILGFNPITVMPLDFMYMAIQIQHPDFIVFFNLALYLEEKIHEGLLDIKNDVFNTQF